MKKNLLGLACLLMLNQCGQDTTSEVKQEQQEDRKPKSVLERNQKQDETLPTPKETGSKRTDPKQEPEGLPDPGEAPATDLYEIPPAPVEDLPAPTIEPSAKKSTVKVSEKVEDQPNRFIGYNANPFTNPRHQVKSFANAGYLVRTFKSCRPFATGWEVSSGRPVYEEKDCDLALLFRRYETADLHNRLANEKRRPPYLEIRRKSIEATSDDLEKRAVALKMLATYAHKYPAMGQSYQFLDFYVQVFEFYASHTEPQPLLHEVSEEERLATETMVRALRDLGWNPVSEKSRPASR